MSIIQFLPWQYELCGPGSKLSELVKTIESGEEREANTDTESTSHKTGGTARVFSSFTQDIYVTSSFG